MRIILYQHIAHTFVSDQQHNCKYVVEQIHLGGKNKKINNEI